MTRQPVEEVAIRVAIRALEDAIARARSNTVRVLCNEASQKLHLALGELADTPRAKP